MSTSHQLTVRNRRFLINQLKSLLMACWSWWTLLLALLLCFASLRISKHISITPRHPIAVRTEQRDSSDGSVRRKPGRLIRGLRLVNHRSVGDQSRDKRKPDGGRHGTDLGTVHSSIQEVLVIARCPVTVTAWWQWRGGTDQIIESIIPVIVIITGICFASECAIQWYCCRPQWH